MNVATLDEKNSCKFSLITGFYLFIFFKKGVSQRSGSESFYEVGSGGMFTV